MKFTIAIVGRDKVDSPHAACFEDVAEALRDALRELGHEVVGFDNPGRLIVFGAVGRMADPFKQMPKDAILFNAEQVPAIKNAELNDYTDHVFWDYSRSNIEALKEVGIKKAIHCPIGYIPSMTKIKPATEQDIDVLFYGAINARRRIILEDLTEAGLRVERLFGVYGAERDEYIARSKVILNVHFYDKPIFEIFRVSHLLANRKCVVSEDGGYDLDLESFARSATELVSYTRLVRRCKEMVQFPHLRQTAERRGFEELKKINFVESVRRAVEQS